MNTLIQTPLDVSLAYLDGGSGSMVFQVVLASLLTGGYIIKGHWAKVQTMLKARVRNRTEG